MTTTTFALVASNPDAARRVSLNSMNPAQGRPGWDWMRFVPDDIVGSLNVQQLV